MIGIIAFFFIIAFLLACGEGFYERDWPRRMAKYVGIFALLLCASVMAFGQTASYFSANVTTVSRNAPSGASAPVFTVPFANVTVCGYPATPTGATCTNKVSVYSDQALTQPIVQPFSADAQGQFGFWAANGTYAYSVQNAGGAYLGTYTITLGSAISGNPISGASAEYPFNEGMGTIVHDISGSGNNASFDTGTHSPTWYSYGAALQDTGSTPGATYQDIVTPLTTWGAFYIGYCTPSLVQTSGAVPGLPSNLNPTLTGALTGATGVAIIGQDGTNSYGYNTFAPNIYALGFGLSTRVSKGFGGCHVFGYSAAALDHITIDGVEPSTYVTQESNASRIPLQIPGITYRIGTGGANPTINGLRGVVQYAVYYPSAHTVAQMAQESAYIQGKLSQRGFFPQTATLLNSTTGQMIAAGDSITAGYPAATSWVSNLAFNSGYHVNNYGIAGMQTEDLCEMGDQRWAQSIVPGVTVIQFWAGTNNLQAGDSVSKALAYLSDCALKAKRYGARTIVATMMDRIGLSTAKNSYNTGLRSFYKLLGFDKLNDIAEVQALGADGANSNTSCFVDAIHPTSSGSCGSIAGVSYSGYGLITQLVQNAVNTMDGSSQQFPDITTSNAYVETYANNYVIQGPTAAATHALVDCQGQDSPRTIVNTGNYSITVTAFSGELVVGGSVVPAGGKATFIPVLNSPTTGGCNWINAH